MTENQENKKASIPQMILSITIFLAILFGIMGLREGWFKSKDTKGDNKAENSSNTESIQGDDVKTFSDLQKYIDGMVADYLCERWTKACNYNNKRNRQEQQLSAELEIENFIRSILIMRIQANDLPDDFVPRGQDYCYKKLESCGYYIDRTKWKGYERDASGDESKRKWDTDSPDF